MQTSPLLHEKDASQGSPTGTVYHCVCGQEFPVDPSSGGICPSCKRKVTAEAIRNASSATVSIHDLNSTQEVHHFEVEPSDALTHKVFGHFRIERPLGGGGMGTVYRALDMSLQRYVAVKVIHQRGECTDSRLKAMLREAVAQARLNHPNVVTIYYVGRQGEEPFLAMELLPGPTLAERLQSSGPIPYGEAILYAIQVVEALKHASEFDLVHADIKPANLIMAGDGRIKLSDFGLSRVRTSEDSDRPISGTPAYVAPEIVAGLGLSIQSDMYALGVTLFELVFGRLPFELVGETVRDKLQTHQVATIEFPKPWPQSVPREFSRLVSQLLAKDPKARFSNYDTLLDELESIAPVSTTAAGYAPRTMAFILDQLVLLLGIAPFAITIFAINGMKLAGTLNIRLLIPIIAFASLIVPALYLFAIYRGWPSIGRYLFQLRIVEEHGLPPRREQLVPREVLRNAFAWCFPLALYVSLSSVWLAQAIEFGLILFLAVNTITLFLMSKRKALHDYLCRSQVVLATDKKVKNRHASH
ncbi:MAG: protein kinase [Pirellula sp.]|nr:protein kinase [Pirellula sp.]